MATEAWLDGALENVSPLLMPAAHALAEAAKDVRCAPHELSAAEIWSQPNGAPSVAFHLRHLAGSIDRLLTYARGESLTETQFAALAVESEINEMATTEMLIENAVAAIETALAQIRATPNDELFEARLVGRQKLPTNVFGLLFHIAEHTQRHVGQIVTTARIIKK